MLRRVAVFGSGKNANAAGYVVGGKTGTADKYTAGSQDTRIASFIGAFPIHDPEYVILVSIDEPKPQEWTYGHATGGWVAAPRFQNHRGKNRAPFRRAAGDNRPLWPGCQSPFNPPRPQI